MGSPAVSVAGLRVERGGREVVRGVSFDLHAGTVTGLLGPSGSGKSTVIRALVGVQQHVRGEVALLGEPAGSPSLRRRVAYVTQAPSVYGDLTVGENLRYFARVLGADDVGDVLRTVDLERHERTVVGRLSGGERARVSLASALLASPEVLVLDEPTVGLDPVLRADLWDEFRRLAASGATLLVTSHVMDEAERCDRVLLLRDGVLLADDTPEHLRAATGATGLDAAFLALVRQEAS